MPIADQVKISLEAARQMSEDELLSQLGQQLDTIHMDWDTAEQLRAATPPPPASMVDTAKLAGPIKDKFLKIGKRFWDAYNKSLYNLICTASDDDHKKLKEAAAHGAQSLGLVIAGVLAAHFAWLPAVVVFVASLLLKRFANVTIETGCGLWKESLPT
jgi:hypothetical protein